MGICSNFIPLYLEIDFFGSYIFLYMPFNFTFRWKKMF